MKKMRIQIEKYIKDYELRRMTVSEIAKIEDVSESTIYKKINEYYERARTRKT